MAKIKVNADLKGFVFWILITFVLYSFISPFEIAIWRDRSYLLYMSQSVYRGVDLYEFTPLGYTPLAPLISGVIMRMNSWIFNGVDTIEVARIMGMILHGVIAGSLFVLAKSIFVNSRLVCLVPLLFLGFFQLLEISATNFEPKLLALCFEIWGIHYAIKGRWLQTGLLFSLAAMCWQPMVINCFFVFLFILLKFGSTKVSLRYFSLLLLGVILGTLPCLTYLCYTNDWIYFWDQAVIRKVVLEGSEVFELPFGWIEKIILRQYVLDLLPFVLAGLGGLKWFLCFIKEKERLPDYSMVVLYLFLGWIIFNSFEYQGTLDAVPIIPFVLILAVEGIKNILLKVSATKYVLTVIGLVSFSCFDMFLISNKATYSDQMRRISDLNDKYKNPIVINFEEFYVLQERALPTSYIRMGRFEDSTIEHKEIGGCQGLVNKIDVLKPKAIINRIGNVNGLSGVGECGEKIIDDLAVKKLDIFSFSMGRINPLKSESYKIEYQVYKTQYDSLEP